MLWRGVRLIVILPLTSLHGSVATGVVCKKETLTIQGHLV